VFFKTFFHFSNFLYSTAGSHNRLRPGVIYLLLSISTGLGTLIYALINALKKLTHCVNALKKLAPWQLYLKPFLSAITCFTYFQNLGVLTFIILSYTGDWGESFNSRVGYRIKRFADAWNRSSSTFYLLPCTCVYVYVGQHNALRGATLWMI